MIISEKNSETTNLHYWYNIAMKNTLIIVFIICISSANVFASDSWSKSDIYRELAYIAVLSIDFEQTKSGLANLDGVQESNVFLGERPNNKKINEYVAGMIVGHAIISNHLSSSNRKLFQNITIIYHANIIYKNHMIGARINF